MSANYSEGVEVDEKDSREVYSTEKSLTRRLVETLDFATEWLETFNSSPYWKLKALAICLLITFIFTAPFFNFIYFDTPAWGIIARQAQNLLSPINASPETHDAKKMFRLTVPLLAALFKLDKIGLFGLQVSSGIGIYWLILSIAVRLTKDRVVALLTALACSSCYFTFSAFYDVFGRVDAFAYFFLLATIYFRTPVVIYACALLAAFCDERAFINLSFSFIFWVYTESGGRTGFLTYLRSNSKALAIQLAAFSYLLLRWLLIHNYGFITHTEGIGLRILLESRHHVPLGVFFSFGLLWVFLLFGCYLLYLKRNWSTLLLMALSLGVSTCISVLVYDINRSISFECVALLVGVYIVNRHTSVWFTRRFLLVICCLSVFIPIYHFDSKLHYQPTIFVRLFELVMQ